jgi:hypothetical protein
LLDYNPETGVLRWKYRTPDMFQDGKLTAAQICAGWNGKHAGAVAGTPHNRGYLHIRIYGRDYLSHRLAWLVVTGEWPTAEIDHANLDKADNRWANLRQAARSQNCANKHVQSNNTSGHKGVHWNKKCGRWVAYIKKSGRRFYLGMFDDIDSASEAYDRASAEHFGDFARAS